MKIIKKLLSTLCAVCIILSMVAPALASETQNLVPASSNIQVFDEHVMPINDEAITLVAHDGRTANNSIVPYSTVIEEYVSSTYGVKSYGIVSYNVGPRENDTFLLSVPKGGARTITTTKAVSATVAFSGSVDFNVKKIVNMKLGLEASGSYTYTYSMTKSYSGPEGNYTTRDYYGAIQYDQFAFTVSKTDKYAVYKILPDGTRSFLYYENVPASDIYLSSVKKPKAIEYYRDFNN